MTPTRPRIHVYGVAGYNLGDDAIAFVGEREIRRIVPGARVRIASHAPGALKERYGLDEIPVDRRSLRGIAGLVDSLRRADVVIIGGGTLVQDKLGLTRLRGVLAYVQQIAFLAKAFDKPLGTLAIGVDELRTTLGERYARQVLRTLDTLVVRDDRSLELAATYGGDRKREGHRAADPAFLLDEYVPESPNPSPFGRYAVLSLVNEDLDQAWLLAALAEILPGFLEDNDLDGLILLAMDVRPEDETSVFRTWLARHPDLAPLCHLLVPADALEAFRVVTAARFVLALRLHAMIFALGHVPLMGVSRTTKTDTFLRDAGVEGLPVDEPIPAAALATRMTRVLHDHEAVARQAKRRAAYRDDARRGIETLVLSLVRPEREAV